MCGWCVSHHVRDVSIAGMQNHKIWHNLDRSHIVDQKWRVDCLLTDFCGRWGSAVHVALDCSDHAFVLLGGTTDTVT